MERLILFPSNHLLSECLPSTYQDKLGTDAGPDAWLRMRKISADMERSDEHKMEDVQPLHLIKEDQKQTRFVASENINDNTLDLISFSSDISFSSGYRSSNLDESAERESESIEIITDILKEVLDNIDSENKIISKRNKYLKYINKENHTTLQL